ncbi:MAG: hypothetical protein BJ554DRAFT_8133 [Olpidium bornovanus]|uniref:Uncharacterized protein n=1 Tax=Olpidium bornovanus TaxID=278681 RepID=A0A8H8DIW7_9FUNG|nr:MAG: hypothetical protein BJ554DRAFT_8133 [Olpidium bornovanus]
MVGSFPSPALRPGRSWQHPAGLAHKPIAANQAPKAQTQRRRARNKLEAELTEVFSTRLRGGNRPSATLSNLRWAKAF